MKNKFIKDISAFLLVSAALILFISSSASNSVNLGPDTKILIKCSNLEENKNQLEKDLPRLEGVVDVEISPEVDQISISINSDQFDPNSVQKVLNKWEIKSQNREEWESEIIASSEF
tara:strand:- start:239 stop:589 length:351 start_codon:yes stop_codon:yes gene_type:complete